MTHTLVASATREHIIGFDRPFTVIGEVVAGGGLSARTADGRTTSLTPRGYEHAFDG